ncbi:MAG: biotin--[acetyl-CoA-carboxylase] ligase [Helicobacteraceae bacterium]|jgi:BirA family biotin operon repressor/biotin-[acetyl-CoA-carboxylase] ligase|nr:biotin--[acetyl-CoA-carboxylase] ligase [Helicobacteraceae bacterium]
MRIIYLESCESTQILVENALKSGELAPPFCLWTLNQTDGIGSRENKWRSASGNLAFSFALSRESLPADLPPQSASIYFGTLFKMTLADFGSQAWLKWPNDLYINKKKCGGIITKAIAKPDSQALICGIGLNIASPDPKIYGAIDIKIVDFESLLAGYLGKISRKTAYSLVFSEFGLEFARSLSQGLELNAHINGVKTSLKDAILNDDGSLTIGAERVYSQR